MKDIYKKINCTAVVTGWKGAQPFETGREEPQRRRTEQVEQLVKGTYKKKKKEVSNINKEKEKTFQ